MIKVNKLNNEFSKNKWILIGGGGAFDSTNTSYYKISGTVLSLIDCGEQNIHKIINIISSFRDKIEKIHLYITHCHFDHIGGISTLTYACKYKFNIPLLISAYCEEHAVNIQDLLRIGGNKDGYEVCLLGQGIIPIKVNHVDDMTCFGYYDYTNKTFISGDLHTFPYEVFDLCIVEKMFLEATKTKSDVHLFVDNDYSILKEFPIGTKVTFVHNESYLSSEKAMLSELEFEVV